MDYAAIGQRIKQVRRSRGLTQERLFDDMYIETLEPEGETEELNLEGLAEDIGE